MYSREEAGSHPVIKKFKEILRAIKKDAIKYLNNAISENMCKRIFSVIQSEEFFNIDEKEKVKLRKDIKKINNMQLFDPKNQKSDVCKRWSMVIKLAILTMAINS